MRIKKIAERRTIWGGGHLGRQRGADDRSRCRPDQHAQWTRRGASATCPDGVAALKRPRWRSRGGGGAGSSGSLQAGSRLVARVQPRPGPASPFWACEVPFSPSFAASDAPRFGIRRSGFAAFRRDLTRLTSIPNVFRRYRTSSFRSRRLHARRALGTWPRRHSRRRLAVTRETRSFDVVVPHR